CPGSRAPRPARLSGDGHRSRHGVGRRTGPPPSRADARRALRLRGDPSGVPRRARELRRPTLLRPVCLGRSAGRDPRRGGRRRGLRGGRRARAPSAAPGAAARPRADALRGAVDPDGPGADPAGAPRPAPARGAPRGRRGRPPAGRLLRARPGGVPMSPATAPPLRTKAAPTTALDPVAAKRTALGLDHPATCLAELVEQAARDSLAPLAFLDLVL